MYYSKEKSRSTTIREKKENLQSLKNSGSGVGNALGGK
jgi:hypothetical protein